MSHRIALATLGLLSLAFVANAKPNGGKKMHTPEAKEATFVTLKSLPGKEHQVEALLKSGAATVKHGEPNTLQWYGLQEGPGKYAIIDFFPDPKGRDVHFQGKVAAALNASAGATLEGGWEKGVLPNVVNSQVLSSSITADKPHAAKIALRIDFRAKPGKEAALAKLLAGAAETIRKTEPATLVFYAIQDGPDRFSIFDAFAGDEGKGAHFAGQVAAALKSHAEDLVVGGWEQGMVANVKAYQILSSTY